MRELQEYVELFGGVGEISSLGLSAGLPHDDKLPTSSPPKSRGVGAPPNGESPRLQVTCRMFRQRWSDNALLQIGIT